MLLHTSKLRNSQIVETKRCAPFWQITNRHVCKLFMWIHVNNNRCRSTSFSYVYYHRVQYVVLECERDVKLTCLINPPQCFTQKCQKLGQFSNFWILAPSTTQGIPPTFDGYIPNICFFQWYGILVFIA